MKGGLIMKRSTKVMHKSRKGQALVEYALLLALVSVASVFALTFLGGQINKMLTNVGTQLEQVNTTIEDNSSDSGTLPPCNGNGHGHGNHYGYMQGACIDN